MRIVGGEWRGRKVSFADIEGLRPTPDRVRETLFNWLQFHIAGARCLDVFAGSGILGIEAVSRGASSAFLIERDSKACAEIERTIETLGTKQVGLHRGDAIDMLSTPPNQAYDMVFIDPPFRQDLVAPTINLLEIHDWLAPGSKIYIEMEANSSLTSLPVSWRLGKSKTAGDVAFYLCEKH